MKSSKKYRPLLILPAIFFIISLSFWNDANAASRQDAIVKEVLSGDSVRLAGGKTLRYIGVQSPGLTSKIPLTREYGENAKKYNESLVGAKKIQIEWDAQVRDNKGNLLGYVFLEDSTFVNQAILKAGHGKATLPPPNLKYVSLLRKAEVDARKGRLAMWEKEPKDPFLEVEYWGDKNTKIYYLPNSPELDRIPQSFLVKFRSRVEAKAAGFKPCFTCKGEGDPYEDTGY